MHYVFATSGTNNEDRTDFSNCYERGLLGRCGEPANDTKYRLGIARAGNPNLEEETGDSLTLGVVWDATRNLSLSADYWSMTIDAQIEDFGTDDILEGVFKFD